VGRNLGGRRKVPWGKEETAGFRCQSRMGEPGARRKEHFLKGGHHQIKEKEHSWRKQDGEGQKRGAERTGGQRYTSRGDAAQPLKKGGRRLGGGVDHPIKQQQVKGKKGTKKKKAPQARGKKEEKGGLIKAAVHVLNMGTTTYKAFEERACSQDDDSDSTGGENAKREKRTRPTEGPISRAESAGKMIPG